MEKSNLGAQLGPLNISVSCCADDFLGMTDDPFKLQCILDIAEHYGNMYEISYGADKTKIVVYGSKIDQQYYLEVCPWKMYGTKVSVVCENEHLGQILSNTCEYQKNVDENISKARKSLFSVLGFTYAENCHLSPAVKIHIMNTYISPIMKSGLSSFALRKNNISSLDIFHKKMLKNILKFSQSAPTSPLYFLTGQLPLTAQLHINVYSLFYNVWTNKTSNIFRIVKYLLESSNEKSHTWSVHVRNISRMYGITCTGK